MPYLNKFLVAMVLILLAGLLINPSNDSQDSFLFNEDSGAFSFVIAQSSIYVSPWCNSPNGKVEVFIAGNIHASEGYTGYGVTLVAGRCPMYRFTSRINQTTGGHQSLKLAIKNDIINHIQTNNVSFNMMKFGSGQKLDFWGNFTI